MKTQVIMTLLIDGEVAEGVALEAIELENDFTSLNDAVEAFNDLANQTQITIDKYHTHL